ncbi:hypothetical protein BTO01_20455 [Vibrio jasicida]|uniref:ATP-binding protein n=1 Tax=Vibrio jasicida TaxID=766224 RepID=UPI000CF41646|nr:AAA family ATPase [Vibrio jasicida]PQJ59212.1 hypothetical protein BTO01_20455 [Vibrio jasicida]
MLNSVDIKGFKSLHNESIKISPYTIITGLNSSGKSTVIQAILLAVKYSKEQNIYKMEPFTQYLDEFSAIRNKNINAKAVEISLSGKEGTCNVIVTSEGLSHEGDVNLGVDLTSKQEKPELFYLNANRQGPEELAHQSRLALLDSIYLVISIILKITRCQKICVIIKNQKRSAIK